MGTYGKLMQKLDSDLGVTTEIKSSGEPERATKADEGNDSTFFDFWNQVLMDFSTQFNLLLTQANFEVIVLKI